MAQVVKIHMEDKSYFSNSDLVYRHWGLIFIVTKSDYKSILKWRQSLNYLPIVGTDYEVEHIDGLM